MAIDRESWRSENAGTQIVDSVGLANLKASRIKIQNKAE
jgi:hypothetical protein